MANGDESGNDPNNQVPKARGVLEKELAEERLQVLKNTTIAIKKQALEEGKLLEALRATIKLEQEKARIQLEYGDAADRSRESLLEEVEVLEARQRVLEKTIGLGPKLKSALQIPDSGLGNFIDDLTKAQLKLGDDKKGLIGTIGELAEGIFTAGNAFRQASKALASFAALGVTQAIKLGVQVDKTTAAFTAQTGIIGSLRDSIDDIAVANFRLGIGTDQVSKATTSLVSGFSEFVALSQAQQTTLVENAAQLQKIGLSTDTFASSVNELNKSFGMTPSMTTSAIRSLSALGIELGIGADQINQNFVQSLPTLRVYGDRAVEVFRELQIQARETGTSISTLTSTFGSQFDTFEGSARAAGRLNAVLGTDLFSTTELLLATESERVDIMRERLAMSGVEFANLGKFQQLALANAAGISDVNEAAKIFGNTQSEVTTQIGGLSLTQAELEERIQKGRDVFEKLQFALSSFAIAVEPVINGLAFIGNGLVAVSEIAGRGGLLGRSLVAGGVLLASYALSVKATSLAFNALAVSAVRAAASVTAANAATQGAGAAGVGGAISGRALAGGALRAAGGVALGGTGGFAAGQAGGSALGLEGQGAGAFTGALTALGLLGGAALTVGTGGLAAVPLLGWLAAAGVGGGIGAMASAQDGGITTQDGIMQVHSQEAIVPLGVLMSKFDELISAVKPSAGGEGGNIVVKVMMNERELGEAIVPMIDRRVLGK